MKNTNKGKSSLIAIALFTGIILGISACFTVERGGGEIVIGSRSGPEHPDYEKSRAEFVEADFGVIASEFIDEYAGQYVVFEGMYMNHHEGVVFQRGMAQAGRPVSMGDVMAAMIGGPGGMGDGRYTQIIWSTHDRELGRPFLDARPQQTPVRIYGYVLPAGEKARIKTRDDLVFERIAIPVVLLVEAVVNPE